MDTLPDRSIPVDFPSFSPLGLRAAYAKSLLSKYLNENEIESEAPRNFRPIPAYSHLGSQFQEAEPYAGKIAIVGAGIAGLYTAMLLKYVGITNVDILEASDRVGGRCYTYEFPDDKSCPHNYYDIGAMRIPEIGTMNSTLNLIHNLGLDDKKAEYVYSDNKQDVPNLWLFKRETPSGKQFEDAIAGTVKDFLVDNEKNWEKAFAEYLAKDDDNYSTRAWLMLKKGFSFQDTVNAEAADTSTGLFDQAFTETICDYCDFQAAKNATWWRIEKGMSLIPETMEEKLLSADWPPADVRGDLPATPIKITYNRPVVAMADKGHAVHVTTTNTAGHDRKTEAYDMVFNTTAMAPLQRMDIEGLKLPDNVLTAIRMLSYDRATKVAIKFKSPWWKIFGCVSSTDLPMSNVVYPSWDDGPDAPAVLMVSYSWAQDATRMGALVPPYGPGQTQPHIDEPVVATCLAGLVKLFAGRKETPHITLEFLRSQYVTHHAYAWSHDPLTGGAFALFGPGQFKNVYPQFMHLFAGGKFALSGEALSAHHAWISGAIDSAYCSVVAWFMAAHLLREESLVKDSPLGGGPGLHPAELDEGLLYRAVMMSDGCTEGEGDY
ncbi:hypothetical protein B0T24DRAFT_679621 [Lasiosphaeria ovina]|uniref:Amine oxidase domain-containing protein n=1 Tax=Lasiosphaeria ovina TaxID=92902 RepID=A0AAE0N820_9PEZI|nr:hypothetical protein B0T24DRAFT_679621 [Lasiosphaeria ovina]